LSQRRVFLPEKKGENGSKYRNVLGITVFQLGKQKILHEIHDVFVTPREFKGRRVQRETGTALCPCVPLAAGGTAVTY
jgi:hypothetical protein